MAKWLDDEEMKAWRGLVEVFADVEASLGAELVEGHAISHGDYAVLVALSEADDHRRRMCDLAALLHLSPSGLTRRLDGLVRKGFVARVALPDDRRVTLAVLTTKGMAKLEEGGATTRRRRPPSPARPPEPHTDPPMGNVLSTVQRRRSEVAAND